MRRLLVPGRRRPPRIRYGWAVRPWTVAVYAALVAGSGCLPTQVARPPVIEPAAEQYQLVFSTYFGGRNWEHARDVCVDTDGNVIMVGGTASPDFPTTPGAFDVSLNVGGRELGKAGQCDAFVAKFSPDGQLLWSTYLGGPNYDRAYGVEVDRDGFIYVAGRAGRGFPVTSDAFQTEYGGSFDNRFYGSQNGFVGKMTPDGRQLVWASYVGVGELCRDIAIDTEGDVYVPLAWNPSSHRVKRPAWMDTAFTNAFRPEPSGKFETGVVKIQSDGTGVVWASWMGGSGKDTQEASLRVDAQQRAYITFNTMSVDVPTSENASCRQLMGKEDGFVACLSSDGSQLVFGTYLGGSDIDWIINTHNLAIDHDGNVFVSVATKSSDFPTSDDAYCRTHSGDIDIAITKLSPRGELIASTFVGGSGAENPDGIYVDDHGDILIVGETFSNNFPVTENAFQTAHGGKGDAIVVRLSSDMRRLLYSTFMGGPSVDNGRSAFLSETGDLYLTGASSGKGWPVHKAFQSRFAGGGRKFGNGDCLLARFEKQTDSVGTARHGRIRGVQATRIVERRGGIHNRAN